MLAVHTHTHTHRERERERERERDVMRSQTVEVSGASVHRKAEDKHFNIFVFLSWSLVH